MSFSLNQHNIEQLLVLELTGKILSDGDLETAKASLDKITNWNIVMDLSNLTHSNSSGIAFMVKTLTRSRINNGDVAIVKPNAQLAKLFEITKMGEVFSIYESLEDAKKHFNK
jgi:anti-sigma B factor antagonist